MRYYHVYLFMFITLVANASASRAEVSRASLQKLVRQDVTQVLTQSPYYHAGSPELVSRISKVTGDMESAVGEIPQSEVSDAVATWLRWSIVYEVKSSAAWLLGKDIDWAMDEGLFHSSVVARTRTLTRANDELFLRLRTQWRPEVKQFQVLFRRYFVALFAGVRLFRLNVDALLFIGRLHDSALIIQAIEPDFSTGNWDVRSRPIDSALMTYALVLLSARCLHSNADAGIDGIENIISRAYNLDGPVLKKGLLSFEIAKPMIDAYFEKIFPEKDGVLVGDFFQLDWSLYGAGFGGMVPGYVLNPAPFPPGNAWIEFNNLPAAWQMLLPASDKLSVRQDPRTEFHP